MHNTPPKLSSEWLSQVEKPQTSLHPYVFSNAYLSKGASDAIDSVRIESWKRHTYWFMTTFNIFCTFRSYTCSRNKQARKTKKKNFAN